MSRRKPAPTFEHAVHHMVHHGKHDVTELADMLGVSDSSLYRSANPYDEGANFPAKRLTGAMIAQNDFGPLYHMASRCGFVLYKISGRVRMSPDEISELQRVQSEATHSLLRFFAGEIDQHEAIQKIDAAISGMARARRSVEHGIKQEELQL